MGSQESKSVEQFPKLEEESKDSEHDDSLPSTPILTPLDPRSPSTNIARTPLDLILGVKTKIENPADTTEEDQVITKTVILNIDPRSPTVEFNRTPIIVSTKEKPAKLNNKNLDNVQTDLDNVHKKEEKLISETPTVGSLTPIQDEIENQMNSLDIESQQVPSDETPKDEDDNENEQVEEEKTEEVEVKTVECVDETDKIQEEKTINITAHVNDFDKKLTNLIYQDESDDEDNKLGLRLAKIKENSRTPLGTRNSNEEPKKPTSRLRVSDKPRKIELSKIPVFRDTYGKKIGIQCENTPPKKTEEKRFKTKVSHWDGDKTLII